MGKHAWEHAVAIVTRKNPTTSNDLSREKSTLKGWFQRRKAAAKILSSLTEDTIVLDENGYRGHDNRHWMRHTVCGARFRASLKEISVKPTLSCPFCCVRDVTDLGQFGSVAAVQELVSIIASDGLEFLSSNELGHVDDVYSFYCHHHDHTAYSTFRNFVERPDETCVDCFFDDLLRRTSRTYKIEDFDDDD